MRKTLCTLALLLCLLLPLTAQAVTLQAGDRGAAVETLQARLVELGYLTGTPHGLFEEVTEAALTDFQAVNGLAQDGIATDAVQTLLYGADALSRDGTPGAADASPSGSTYIGNRNTHKFHFCGCPAVDTMNAENKVALSSREEALNAGYVPCKRCDP